MGFGRRWLACAGSALVTLFAIALLAPQSSAAPRFCRQLEAELAAASGRGNPAQIKRYDEAIARQRSEIAKGRSRYRNAGCGFAVFSSGALQCADLNAAIERMNGNLDLLQRQRSRLAGSRSRRDRAEILASLNANGCRTPTPQQAKQSPAPKKTDMDLFERLNKGNKRLDQDPASDEQRNIRVAVDPGRQPVLPEPGAQYRTLCVRTCDGYFYPMSNAASLGQFERDQKNCNASCPGTEMQVFYTEGMNSSTDDMTSSATGRPYSDLSTAYLYKKTGWSRPPACGCGAVNGATNGSFQIIAGSSAASGAPALPETPKIEQSNSFVSITVPEAAADAGLDVPENDAPANPVSDEALANRKVRVVGPTFLPAPEAARGLQAPAPTEHR